MTPFLADGINVPFVLGAGVIVLVPLLAFEVFAEAFVLRKMWHQQFGELCRFTFRANVWSLVAGIPTKIFNAWLYGFLLPGDLPGFFARYPLAVGIGTLNYFVVTVAVEGLCAVRWLKKEQYPISKSDLWKGILLANVTTYAVLGPLHYFATRPSHQVSQFVPNASWCSETNSILLFVDQKEQLNSVRLNGSQLTKLVPGIVRDYLISTNLNLCLFRSKDGNLHYYRRDTGQSNVVWQTHERFHMEQVAFSPSGEHVACAESEGNYLEVLEIGTGKRTHYVLPPKFSFQGPSVAWSNDEMKFYLRGFEKEGPVEVKLQPDMTLQIESLENTNDLALLPCLGRVGTASRYWGSDDWGCCYDADKCGDLKLWSEPGLGSGLRIYRDGTERNSTIMHLHVNPGLLHMARFYFGDAAFVDNCHQCLFEANGYLYLLDLETKRVGTLARGDRFILLTDRYRKGF